MIRVVRQGGMHGDREWSCAAWSPLSASTYGAAGTYRSSEAQLCGRVIKHPKIPFAFPSAAVFSKFLGGRTGCA